MAGFVKMTCTWPYGRHSPPYIYYSHTSIIRGSRAYQILKTAYNRGPRIIEARIIEV